MICGLSIAARDGSHLSCALAEGHNGGCVARRNPAGAKTSELLRQASSMVRVVAPAIGSELELRALVLEQFEVRAERDRRRGFFLPLAWINELQGSAEPMAQPWNDNDGAVLR